MRSRSAPGSSTLTWRLTKFNSLPLWGRVGVGTALVAVGAIYVVVAFTAQNPLLRIALRCLPVLPVAIWTIWFDRARPLETRTPLIRTSGRIILLLVVMAFTVLLLGIGLNWLYDPNRVV